MTTIDDAFDQLVSLLADATITLFDSNTPIPVDNVAAFALNPVDPPFIEVRPSVASDYLTFDDEGIFFGNAVLHAAILIAVPAADSDIEAAQVNDLIVQIIQLLMPSPDFAVTSARTNPVEVNGQTYAGAIVEVGTQISLRPTNI
jgi:hypothetical protein